MATKTLIKVGGNGGAGTWSVVDTDGTISVEVDGTQQSAIADISVTGTYATDDTPIETAINGILAALRNAGIIAT